MSPDEFALLAAVSFAAERRAYYAGLAGDAELELLVLEVEEAERQLGRREVGRRYAELLGLPSALAPVLAVMVLSPSYEARSRAAGLIVRGLQRPARRKHDDHGETPPSIGKVA